MQVIKTRTRLLDRQARQLDRELTALIKRYQFRDRNRVLCDGITVSQCYALREIAMEGSLVMTKLAGRMYLSLSAMTRVADQLEASGLVRRRRLPADRRVHLVELTAAGRVLLRRIDARTRSREREVLARLSPSEREGLIAGLHRLNEVLGPMDSYLRDANES